MSIVSVTEYTNYLQAANGITVPASGLTALAQLLGAIEKAVKKFLGFNVEQATYTEYYPEVGYSNIESDPLVAGYDMSVGGVAYPYRLGDFSRSILQLRELPVRSITSIYENSAAWLTAGGSWPAGTLVDPAVYYLDIVQSGYSWTGQIIRNVGTWTPVRRAIQVTYVAGLTAGEIDSEFPQVKLAILVALAWAYTEAVRFSRAQLMGGPMVNVGIEDFTVGFQAMQQQIGTVGLPPAALKYLEPYVRYSQFI